MVVELSHESFTRPLDLCSGNEPLLSIVVPTRNRSDYARHCLRNLLSIRAAGLEVVVHDNSDDRQLETIVQSEFSDPRIKYFYIPERLAQVDNCELAVGRATGKYVTLIGDDDGVNPEIFEAAEWAAAQDVCALTPGLLASYVWPGVARKHSLAKDDGELTVKSFSGGLSTANAEKAARQCLQKACAGFIENVELVKIYYGIVRRDLLDRVRSLTGRFFNGVSPDIAGAIALSVLGKTAVSVDYPLFLPGTASRSMAGANARKEHVGRLEDQKHLPKDRVDRWPAAIPRIFTVETVWGEAAWCSAEQIGRPDLARELNLPRLCAQIAVLNRRYAGEAYRTLIRTSSGPFHSALNSSRFLFWWTHTWGRRARFLARRLFPMPQAQKVATYHSLPNIYAAGVSLSAHLQSLGVSFQQACGRAAPETSVRS